VEFLGTRTDVPELMGRAAAVVLCSESEAFGWVIVEAMAHGAPVIASAVDGPGEIIEHGRTGLLVPCRDVAGYAAAMRSLLACPGLGASLAENARRAVAERFSAAAMVDGIRAVYREILDHPSCHPNDSTNGSSATPFCPPATSPSGSASWRASASSSGPSGGTANGSTQSATRACRRS
jgi:hypothetical protein